MNKGKNFMRKFSVLQINACLHIGGTGMVAENIGQKVLEEGWDSCIAYARNYIANPPYSLSRTIKIGGKMDFYWHVLSNRIFDNQGLLSKSSTQQLIRQIEEIKPDIINLHNLHGYYLNYPLLFKYIGEKDIPVVWTLHDCWAFTGHCTYFDAVGCYKWKESCEKCPSLKGYPSSLFFDRSKRNYKTKNEVFNSLKRLTLVPVSDWLASLLKDSFLQEHPIRVIHNGIDINRFHPEEKDFQETREKYGIGNEKVILGVASTWDQRKGLDDFITLSSMLSNEFCVVLLGLSEKQINMLPDNIIGLKRTSDFHELLRLYSLSSVFCNPTYEDNFPTTNIEALACGTPVITYRTGGSVEAIDEQTGLIVEKGDVKGLCDAILKITSRSKSEYSTICRERAVTKWNKDNRFCEYIDLYKEILNLK